MLSLLQVEGPQLDKAVDQLTKSSIQIAQAASDYGALKVIFGVFVIFVLLIMVMFIYQIITLNNKIAIISTAAHKTQEYFEGAADRTVGKTQAQVLLRRNLNYFSQIVKYYILRIRLENNICEEQKTKDKIRRIVRNEFNELDTFLGNFICDDKPLSYILEEADVNTLVEFMIEQVYMPKENFTVFSMDQAVDIFMNGIKLDYLQKLS